MADNLSVGVTADVTDLRAKLALAQQDLKDTTAALRSAASEARASGAGWDAQATAISGFAQKAETARGKVQALATDLAQARQAEQQMAAGVTQAGQQVETAHAGMAHSGGVTREVLVMMHETLMGNYTRLGGSTLVLAERTNVLHSVIQALSPAMMGAVGGVLALAGGFALLIIRAAEAEKALRAVTSAAALMGRSTDEAAAGAARIREGLQTAGMGRRDIDAVNLAVARMPGMTQQAREAFAELAPRIRAAMPGEEVEKSFGGIVEAANGGAAAVKRYLGEIDALNDGNLKALATAEATGDKDAARTVLLDTLRVRLAGYDAELKRHQDQVAALNAQPSEFSGMATPSQMPVLNLPQSPLPAAQAEDPAKVKDTENVLALNQANDERLKLDAQLASAERVLAAATASGNTEDVAAAQHAKDVAKARIAALTDPAQQAAYAKYTEMAREADDAAVVSAAAAGKKRVEVTEAGTRAEIAVYQKAAADVSLSDKQREEAHANAVRLSISLTKEETGARTAGADKAFEAEVARYSAEIAAAKGNADQIMTLERQKLDFIRSARGENSREYQEALKEETAAVGSAVEQQVRLIEQAGKRRIADQQATLREELATQQITKAEEAQQLLQFVQSERDQELQALDTLRGTLTEGTVAYKEAMDARTKLIQTFGIQIKNLNAQVMGDDTKAAERFTESWLSDFSQIGRAGEQAFTGLITGQSTLQQAELQVAKAVLTSFITLGTQIAERWLVTELAMTSSSATQAAVRNAQELSISNTGFGTLIAAWMGKETTQTGITTGAAATRATADSGGSWLSALGSMLARWLGLETAKTGATTTGATTRAAADTTAATTGASAIGVAARADIAAAAAVAAAWAFADSAMTGPQGLAAAPGAAAAAEATVMSFQAAVPSLDVGAYDVPRDMMANIHQGEMVVPKDFASGLRSGDTFGGNSLTFNHSPTYAGTGAQMGAQAARDHDVVVGKIVNAFRNGQLRPPHR